MLFFIRQYAAPFKSSSFTFVSILLLFLCFFDVSLAESYSRVEEKDTTDFENRGG